jgi:hypothetical protein
MSNLKMAKTSIGCVTVIVCTPIWYYLLYQILARVDASQAMWVCYWIYAPCGFLFAMVNAILQTATEEDK